MKIIKYGISGLWLSLASTVNFGLTIPTLNDFDRIDTRYTKLINSRGENQLNDFNYKYVLIYNYYVWSGNVFPPINNRI